MKSQIELTASDLCAITRTRNAATSIGFQHWTRDHSDAHGNSLVMYLTAEEALDIAAHFTRLAEALDAEMAEADAHEPFPQRLIDELEAASEVMT